MTPTSADREAAEEIAQTIHAFLHVLYRDEERERAAELVVPIVEKVRRAERERLIERIRWLADEQRRFGFEASMGHYRTLAEQLGERDE